MEADIPTIVNAVLIIAGAAGVPTLLIFLKRAKQKLRAFRNLVVSLDDAWEDDRVTEDEFGKIVKNAKEFVKAV